jgi:hypothetical protein
VPTPFYHLSVAAQLSDHPALAPETRYLIQRFWGAFSLGHTAPDVQVVSGQKRSATHFFKVPISSKARLPWQLMLKQYPQVGAALSLDPEQAVFIAGYLCHLQADWFWVRSIFEPVFGPAQNWDNFSKRLYWHNVLRAYLDVEVISEMETNRFLEIGSLEVRNWLPFILDQHLASWWEYLSRQLQPGNSIKTIEVFADRQGIEIEDFQSMLESEESMQTHVFSHISPQELQKYRVQLIEHNLDLINDYLGPRIAPV